MTTFLQPDEGINVDFAESRQKRDRDRVACFLHLRDLVYLHREAASVSIITFVQTLEAAVIAEKAAREKRPAAARERDAERRREADRQKAAAECAETSVGGQKYRNPGALKLDFTNDRRSLSIACRPNARSGRG